VVSCESERELLLGNQGRVGSDVFSGFDYVALGHLHRPQTASREHNAHYSGSILQYSFSECDHEKGVISIEVEGGSMSWVKVPVPPMRRMTVIEDNLDNILRDPKYERNVDDYVCAKLTDICPSVDIHSKLRSRYPDLLEITIPHLMSEGPDPEQVRKAIDSPIDLFRLFLDKFEWVDPIRREKAIELFAEARMRTERSFRRGSD
jgi:exonuclease SbcD